jgi:hypothetical protein
MLALGAREQGPDAEVIQGQILSVSESLRVVGDVVCDLLARGDVTGVALVIDAPGLLLVGQ